MFAYERVSTEEQADKRNGLEAQRATIDAEAERRDWSVEYFTDAGVSGKVIGRDFKRCFSFSRRARATACSWRS
jgi:DNA invertase Pin-like site-specific DNA recombinase